MALPLLTTWIAVTRAADAGRACRDYSILDERGDPRYQARAYPWRREIVVHESGAPESVHVLLRRRRSFPVSGRVDILAPAGELIGFVRRNGSYGDRAGNAGSFRDARTFSARARESLVVGVLDAIAGNDSSTGGSAPTAYIWLIGSTAVGSLARAPLPAAPDPHAPLGEPTPADHTATPIARIARRLRQLVKAADPVGWKLESKVHADAGDARVLLAAALFTIELSQW